MLREPNKSATSFATALSVCGRGKSYENMSITTIPTCMLRFSSIVLTRNSLNRIYTYYIYVISIYRKYNSSGVAVVPEVDEQRADVALFLSVDELLSEAGPVVPMAHDPMQDHSNVSYV